MTEAVFSKPASVFNSNFYVCDVLFFGLTPKSLLEGRCLRNAGAVTEMTTPRH